MQIHSKRSQGLAPALPMGTLLMGALLASAGCTSVKSIEKSDIEARLEIEIPEDAGPGSFESDELCEYPPTPPRAPAASVDERACSKSSKSWPDCLPDTCAATDFETACVEYCQMNCEREGWFCSSTHCSSSSETETYCDSVAAQDECMDLCNGDVDCLKAACEDRQTRSCMDFKCSGNGSNVCGGQTCDNTCATALDGTCDDGSPINSTKSGCDIGTDCADCGAREDQCFPLGAECFATTQCCGFEDFSAWCVGVADDPALGPLGRCVADCTGSDCDEGFECFDLASDDPDDPTQSACFPFCANSQ